MATFKSRPWVFLQNHGEASSSCHSTPNLFSYRYQKNILSYGLELMKNYERKGLAMKGCKCNGGGYYDISEDEDGFVEVLREVHPYVNLHRGSTFVVLLSGEIIDSPCLDSILKVSLSLFLYLIWIFRASA